jgi:hypothetical protein
MAPALGHDFQWIRDVDPGIDVVDGNALDLHGERDQPHTLWISARAEVARRA